MFFGRLGALRQFRANSRVNTKRGPGQDVSRPILFPDASGDGAAVPICLRPHRKFYGTVREVRPGGVLVVDLDESCGGGTALELPENVTPRVQMPGQPAALREGLVVLMRRNLGHGRVVEGLEIRWGLVAQMLRALAFVSENWRPSEGAGPMHKFFDPALFDFEVDAERLKKLYGPKRYRGVLVDAAEVEKLLREGVDPSDIDVNIEDGVLTISAETAAENEVKEKSYLYRKRRTGSYRRSLRLPDTVDADKAESSYRHGVLTVTFPKQEAKKSRRIEVQVG